MNEPKHTPGPWDYDCDSKGRYFELYAGQETIIDGCDFCSTPHINSEANARLIAAAPELLEALKALVSNIEESNWGIKSPAQYETVALIDARAAIAKAEGAQP